MDAYPPDYVAHNLPFIVLSGLGTRKELEQVPPVQNILSGRAVTSVSSELPVVIGDRANELLQEFLSADGTNSPWNGRTPTRRGLTHGFRIRSVGRVGQAPGECGPVNEMLIFLRTSTSLPKKLMLPRPLQPVLQAALPSHRSHHGSYTPQSRRSPQYRPYIQMESSHLRGWESTNITCLRSSYPSSPLPQTLSRTACMTIN